MASMLGGSDPKLKGPAKRGLTPACRSDLVRIGPSIKQACYFPGVSNPASLVEKLPLHRNKNSSSRLGVHSANSSLTAQRRAFEAWPIMRLSRAASTTALVTSRSKLTSSTCSMERRSAGPEGPRAVRAVAGCGHGELLEEERWHQPVPHRRPSIKTCPRGRRGFPSCPWVKAERNGLPSVGREHRRNVAHALEVNASTRTWRALAT